MADEEVVEEQAPVEEEAPQEEPPQAVPEPVAEPEPEPKEEEPLPPLPEQPRKIAELESIVGELRLLADICEQSLDAVTGATDRHLVQAQLRVFASEMGHFPKALQHLHDFRRHFKEIEKQAMAVESGLTKVRGNSDALSSEETRVIVACASVTDIILSAIWALEDMLSQIRRFTPRLLEIVSFEGDDFEQFTTQRMQTIRLDLLSHSVKSEMRKIQSLQSDIMDLDSLEEHIRELEDASS